MRYLSGWQALNTPLEDGTTADWHPYLYFRGENTRFFTPNPCLGEEGIRERFVPMLGRDERVTSFARAIADLVWLGETRELGGCVRDFLSEKETEELYGYLIKMGESKDTNSFIRSELPLRFWAYQSIPL